VTEALARAGLESSNLIVGIDFTKSNEWTGARSFNRKSLHFIGSSPNPYEQAITIIGRTLAAFDEDNLIPCYGFGDASTHDQDVFSFNSEDRFCNGFEEVLSRYKEIVPQLKLAGLFLFLIWPHFHEMLAKFLNVNVEYFCRANLLCSDHRYGHDHC
jgi:E3 ubiquitin-protein ligase RGLG